MLDALVAYAEREALGDLDFEARTVDYKLCISSEGDFVELRSLAKNGRRSVMSGLPTAPLSKTSVGQPNFLVDNAQYVLGASKDGSRRRSAPICFDSFVDLIRTAAGEAEDDGLAALLRFSERPAEVAKADAELARLEATRAQQRAGCVLVPRLAHDPVHIHARAGVVQWWKTNRDRRRRSNAAGERWQCLITGELGAIVRTHGSIRGEPFPKVGAKIDCVRHARLRVPGAQAG